MIVISLIVFLINKLTNEFVSVVWLCMKMNWQKKMGSNRLAMDDVVGILLSRI